MFYQKKPIEIRRVFLCAKKFLIPFVFFNLVGAFVHLCITKDGWTFGSFLKYAISELYKNESIPLSLSLWFLLSLFIVRNLFMVLNVKLSANIIAFFSVFFAFGLYFNCYCVDSFCCINTKITVPYYIGNFFLGLFFYCCGVLFKKNSMSLKYIYVMLFLYIVHFLYRADIDFRSNFLVLGSNYMLAVVYMLAGVLLINCIFRFYFDKKYIFLTYFGEKSILFYVLHFTFGKVISVWLMDNFKLHGYALYIVCFIMMIGYLFLVNFLFTKKYLKSLIGL